MDRREVESDMPEIEANAKRRIMSLTDAQVRQILIMLADVGSVETLLDLDAILKRPEFNK